MLVDLQNVEKNRLNFDIGSKQSVWKQNVSGTF